MRRIGTHVQKKSNKCKKIFFLWLWSISRKLTFFPESHQTVSLKHTHKTRKISTFVKKKTGLIYGFFWENLFRQYTVFNFYK